MTIVAPFPIPPLLGSMADAMEEIRQMLLRYEEAMVDAPRTPENRRAAQDFDLAVQILQDLEHISQRLAAELPADLMAHHSLPLAGLRLERSRRRFVAAARGAPPPDTPPVPQVDLFASDTSSVFFDIPSPGPNGPAR